MTRIIVGLAVALVIAILLEFVLPVKVYEHHPWWRTLPGIYGIFGALGCACLVAFAKSLGLVLLVPEPDPEAEAKAPIDPAEMEDAR